MRKVLLKGVFIVGASGMMALAQSAPPAGQTAAATDAEITSKVHQALRSDPAVGAAAQHIRVTTKNGVVTLKGRVATTAERDEAVAQAKQIAGDQNVKDDLTVAKK